MQNVARRPLSWKRARSSIGSLSARAASIPMPSAPASRYTSRLSANESRGVVYCPTEKRT
jgi:hypothetical protein